MSKYISVKTLYKCAQVSTSFPTEYRPAGFGVHMPAAATRNTVSRVQLDPNAGADKGALFSGFTGDVVKKLFPGKVEQLDKGIEGFSQNLNSFNEEWKNKILPGMRGWARLGDTFNKVMDWFKDKNHQKLLGAGVGAVGMSLFGDPKHRLANAVLGAGLGYGGTYLLQNRRNITSMLNINNQKGQNNNSNDNQKSGPSAAIDNNNNNKQIYTTDTNAQAVANNI